MGKVFLASLVLALSHGSLFGQSRQDGPIEIPLRIQDGRLMVTAEGPDGAELDFVLGLSMSTLTETGAQRIRGAEAQITLGGVPVNLDQAATVPDVQLSGPTGMPTGVIGAETLNSFDVLIDVPGGRLLLKPVGRFVQWEGVELTNPVAIGVFHDVLIRADVEFGEHVVGGLLDLTAPQLEVNESLRSELDAEGTQVGSFRMGYSGWSDLPSAVTDSPVFRAWDPDGNGFVVVGAPVAYDCAISISWAHAEMRTCPR